MQIFLSQGLGLNAYCSSVQGSTGAKGKVSTCVVECLGKRVVVLTKGRDTITLVDTSQRGLFGEFRGKCLLLTLALRELLKRFERLNLEQRLLLPVCPDKLNTLQQLEFGISGQQRRLLPIGSMGLND